MDIKDMISEQLAEKLTAEMIKLIDIQAMAKRLVPQVEKTLEKHMLKATDEAGAALVEAARDIDWNDILSNAMDDTQLNNAIRKRVVGSLLTIFGGKPGAPKRKK